MAVGREIQALAVWRKEREELVALAVDVASQRFRGAPRTVWLLACYKDVPDSVVVFCAVVEGVLVVRKIKRIACGGKAGGSVDEMPHGADFRVVEECFDNLVEKSD